jgi:hypothetical protein
VQLLDASRDGRSLLISTVTQVVPSRQNKLILVNALDINQIAVIDEGIEGFLTASFEYGMPTAILMIDNTGLIRFNSTGQRTILNSVLKSTGDTADYSEENYVRWAVFSSNSRWLAYTHVNFIAGNENLYLLDMNNMLNPNGPTPTVAPTFTPVGVTANLNLTPLCSPDPATYRTWRISNPNATRSDFGWTLVGGGLADQGYGSVPAAVGAQPGEMFLSTRTLGGDATLQVSVNGINQGSSVNTGQQCAAQATPAVPLQLVAQCSPLPTAYRVWEVRNPNATAVTFTWELEQYTQRGSGSAPAGTVSTPGKATFITRTEATNTTVKLYANNEEQASAATSTTQCAR